MESITHIAGNLDPAVRETLAQLVGHPLPPNQEIVISLPQASPAQNSDSPSENSEDDFELPDWCTFLKDMPEQEWQELRSLILHRTPPKKFRED